MKEIKSIAVVGLGSMGCRRIRLIRQMKKCSIYGIDTNKERCEKAKKEFGLETFPSLNELYKEITVDAVFVSTSPASHYPIIKDALIHNSNVFTEINLLSDGYDELIKIAKEKELELFLSSTPIYSALNAALIKYLKEKKNLTYNYHIGQYLPDWHPWEDYRNFFVANKRTNACRELFAIEMPWLQLAFGKITSVSSISRKCSNLELDYNDNIIATIEHENGNVGILSIDVVSRSAVRKLDVYNEDLYISWNGEPDFYNIYNPKSKCLEVIKVQKQAVHDDRYAAFIDETDYADEIKSFFGCVEQGDKAVYNFIDDKQILAWIDKIEGVNKGESNA